MVYQNLCYDSQQLINIYNKMMIWRQQFSRNNKHRSIGLTCHRSSHLQQNIFVSCCRNFELSPAYRNGFKTVLTRLVMRPKNINLMILGFAACDGDAARKRQSHGGIQEITKTKHTRNEILVMRMLFLMFLLLLIAAVTPLLVPLSADITAVYESWLSLFVLLLYFTGTWRVEGPWAVCWSMALWFGDLTLIDETCIVLLVEFVSISVDIAGYILFPRVLLNIQQQSENCPFCAIVDRGFWASWLIIFDSLV